MLSLADYTIHEQIYVGGNSAVYRGQRSRDKQAVVLKHFCRDYPLPEELARFQLEYEITKKLAFPGVPKPYSLEKYGRSLVIVIEDIGGSALKQLGKLSLRDYLALTLEIVKILEQIHQHQVIHKDLNPANIVLNPTTFQVQIIDFGISSLLAHEIPTRLEGTLNYIAPEQTARMNRLVDYRSDYYSLGVLLYELLTGQLPFRAEDDLGMIHAHIALEPPPPHSINPAIPLSISHLVLKLLAKNAEDRYQSAHGLRYDLNQCLEHLADFNSFTLRLGSRDNSRQLQIPQKLYGREAELATMLETFAQLGQIPHAQLFLIAGYSGIGKSALVSEMHKPLVRTRGYFIAGKYDQLQHNIPYLAISDAFQQLMRQLLTEPDDQIAQWRTELLTALGNSGAVITDLIPDLTLIIGPQPPVLALAATEAFNRFVMLFQQFLGVFARPEHPLVLFLDDLQWIDAASLLLLKALLTESNLAYLLIIGAYRDNEVGPAHPLRMTLNEIQQANISLQEITLYPLTLAQVNQMTADMLTCSAPEVAPLAQLIFAKTQGNPFFINQFLKMLAAEKLLTFANEQWNWQLEVIENQSFTDNVVELMLNKLDHLPPKTQSLLQLAACIGNQFDLRTLSTISEQPLTTVALHLWPAAQAELLIPLANTYQMVNEAWQLGSDQELATLEYRFLHDRIQQAAYQLIPAATKQQVHFRIGQLLLTNLPPDLRKEKIFELVNHLNLGADLFPEPYQLAELNLQAGQKAKAAVAHTAALSYFTAGRVLLAPSCWATHYPLTLTLTKEQAECAFVCGQPEQTEELLQLILQHVTSDAERVEIYVLWAELYTTTGRFAEAFAIGTKGFPLLGLALPTTTEEWTTAISQTHQQIQTSLAGRTVASLSTLPPMTDPQKKLTLRLLMSIFSPASNTNPLATQLITLNMIKLVLEAGNDPLSAFGYVAYGVIFGPITQDYQKAYQFGQLAIQLCQQFEQIVIKGKIYHLYSGFTHAWSKSFHSNLPYLQKAYLFALEEGDIVYGGFAAYQFVMWNYFSEIPLSTAIEQIQPYFEYLQRTKNQGMLDLVLLFRQYFLALHGLTTGPEKLSNSEFDEFAHLQRIEEQNYLICQAQYHILKLDLFFLQGNYEAAGVEEAIIQKINFTMPGGYWDIKHYFYQALTLAALYPTASPEKQVADWQTIETCRQTFAFWATNCPENFRHKELLIQAEMARLQGANWEATELYDQAISSAEQAGFGLSAALANELAAKFYLALNKPHLANHYLREAHYCYLRNGVTTKATALANTYPFLQSSSTDKRTTTSSIKQTTSSEQSTDSLDLATLMKASLAISNEIVLVNLLKTLISIVVENAGAQRGWLILKQDNEWQIEIASDKTEVEAIPLKQATKGAAPWLPASIINYVMHTKAPLVLNDAMEETKFAQDAYVLTHKPKSVLCSPLLHQGQLIGLVYLENNLTANAFTPARLEVLKLLSSQATISLENARLYTNLQSSEAKYRTIFEESRDIILLTGVQGQIEDVSPACEKLLGYTRQELIQLQALDVFVKPTDHARFRELLTQQSLVSDFETQGQRKDGVTRDLLVTAILRHRTEDNAFIGFQGLVRDITDQKQAEQERLKLLAIQQELAVANSIQQSLLPAARPNWPEVDVVCFNLSAKEVGGDFYQYHQFGIQEEAGRTVKRYGFAVGDVSGKGVSAALLMAICLAQLDASLSQPKLTPSERLAYLDSVISPYTKPRHQNCAMCYLELTIAEEASLDAQVLVQIVNAGCIPPYVWRAQGEVTLEEVGGFALGQGYGERLGYQTRMVELAPQDLLILTSDGVVEANNEAGEMFGFERLVEAVQSFSQASSAEAMLEHLKREVFTFTGDAEQHDDMTIVVIAPRPLQSR